MSSTAVETRTATGPVAVVTLSALAVTLVAASLSGVIAPLVLDDPGPLVRWGLPLARVASDLASAMTLGLLLLAAFLVPERRTTQRRQQACRLAAVTGLIWFVASGLGTFLTFASLAGLRLADPELARQFLTFVWSLEATRVLSITTGAALAVTIGALLAQSRAAYAWLAALALAGIVIVALTGHSAGSASHEDAVNSLGVHLVAVSVWVGGLLALAVMQQSIGSDLGATVSRYSVLAGWAYAAVALTGLQQAVIRVGSIEGIASAYGAMVVAKTLILVALGLMGWQQRRRVIASIERDGRGFARLVLVELALMAAAFGLGAVLSRTPPPVPDTELAASAVLSLTGFPDPGPMSAADWLTAWRPNWLMVAIALVSIGVYAAGVRRLARRGDSWPVHRTVLWALGWLAFVWATSGAPDIWGRVQFSVHMVMHMVVAMVVPLLLVPAAPLTLALRALPTRPDRTWGPREVILQVVHSRAMRVLANPVVAAVLFFASLAAFYWSPLFELALTTHSGHLLMLAHFFLTGYLFTWVLIGIDPGPPKWSPAILLFILFATITFHAFFGVALTGTTFVLAPDFFEQVNLPWGPPLLADQERAGEIAWGFGEAPTLVLAILVARQWFRRDRQETVRLDRQAARDDDAALRAYNERLAQLGQRSGENL
ncbi:cytochrome c oxidase assembly protein [Knoellia aerolata]|uniref:Cytochrome C oxidase assembly protein n=1 Tax=Knoellia aerolata DSM 18566 TaxID=1385519 RepID=A0A0A0JWH7_9MICO|nr:cytochrome c oxidase assembly protein [Knoellia aerolata]KGN40999.1 cytochrome C oxidase assembly protein [Knoellia aerolata DSM 18566]